MQRKRRERSRSKEGSGKGRKNEKGKKRSIFGSESSERRKSKHERHRKDKRKRSSSRESVKKHNGDKRREKDRSVSRKSSEESVAEGPCFVPSGILAKYANTVNGVELKFTEPLDSSFPETLWQIFPFKGDEEYDTLTLDGKSCYLFGKDPRVSDFTLENPSCSSQHAVIQFRQITVQLQDGTYKTETRPYLMDLESTNGTELDGVKIESKRYYQLLPKDVIKFGLSQRKYVIMNDPAHILDHNRRLNEKT